MRNDVPTYVYIWYGSNDGQFYILKRSQTCYRTRLAAITTAERDGADIPNCHGGPFLQVLMIPAYESEEEHLIKFGEMLTQSINNCNVS